MTGTRYELHETISVGGQGVVRRGTLVSSVGRRKVALKQLRPSSLEGEARARLLAEAQLVYRLTHANICQVLDVGEGDEGTFLVLEYVDGCDLASLVAEKSRPLDVASVLFVGRELARALDYVHRARDDEGRALGLIHGDVAPQNVLLSTEGEVKLTDFGIARAMNRSEMRKTVEGTPGFVAPEALNGTMDLRADVYSLGATIVHALSGEVPSNGDGVRRLIERLPSGGTLVEILTRALDRKPEARFLSAGAFEQALSLELSRRDPGYTPSKLAEQVRHHQKRTKPNAEVAPRTEPSSLTPVDMSEDEVTVQRRLGERAPDRPHTETAARPIGPTPRGSRVGRIAFWFAGGIAAVAALSFVLGRRTQPQKSVQLVPTVEPAPSVRPPSPPPTTPEPIESSRPSVAEPPSSNTPKRVARGYLTVNATPWGRVFVDDHHAADTPAYRMPIDAGSHVVNVRFADGRWGHPTTVHIAPGKSVELGFTK